MHLILDRRGNQVLFCFPASKAAPITEKRRILRVIMAKKRVRKAFGILYEILSTAVITLGALLAVLYLCGIRLYRVKTGSMGELLPVDSVCFVSTYSRFDALEAGDVIAFRVQEDGMLVTHRAIAVTEKGVYTRGDANDTPDPDPVTRENYIGKTVFALPRLGALFRAVQTVKGMAVLGLCAAGLVILGCFYRQKEE